MGLVEGWALGLAMTSGRIALWVVPLGWCRWC